MANTPFLSGKDAKLRLFIGSDEVLLNCKSWNLDPDVTEAADGVCGEDRDRLITIVNFFTFSATVYNDRLGVVDSWLAYYDSLDSQTAPPIVTAGCNFRILDGSKKAYAASECTLGKCSLAASDRKERFMVTVGFRGRYFKQTKTF